MDKTLPPAKPKSIYRELTIALVLLVSLVSIVVNLLHYFYLSHDAEVRYESKSSEYAIYLREALEWPLWNVDDELIVKIGSAFGSNAEIASLVIRDETQRVVYRQAKPNSGRLITRQVAIDHNGQQIGSVEIGLTLNAYEERDQQLLWASIVTIVLLIVVLFGATRWILSRMLRTPINAFVAAIGDMVAGRYHQIRLPETYQEFTSILAGFQTMSDAVASRERSLQQANLQLSEEIAERGRAQDALRTSEERFAKLMKQVSIPLCYVTEGGVIEDFNDRFAQVFGYPRDEIPTLEAWWQHAYPDPDYRKWVIETWNEAVRQAAETGRDIRPVEYRVTCKNGDVRVMEISGVALGNDTLATFVDITERKEAEDAIKAVSQYSRSLIEASMDPLVTISANGKITDVNRATENVTGVARDKLIGSDFADYFSDPEQARVGYQQAFSQGFVADYPLAIRHASGTVTDVLYNASVYYDDAGKVLGVFAAARDVTERLKAEQEVVQLSQQNRLILDSAGEGIYGLDTEGRCTFVNPAASKLLGFSIEELLGQQTHRMFHHTRPDGSPYPPEACPILASCQKGMVHAGTDLYWRKDGNGFAVDFISTPIREAEKIIGAVVIFSDITERQRAEEALRVSAERLRLATSVGNVGVWDWDVVNNVLTWDESMYALYGVAPEDFGGAYEAWSRMLHPDDREFTEGEIQAALRGEREYAPEFRVVRPDGTVRILQAASQTYRNAQGQPLRMVGINIDVTERKHAEEELRRYKDHLEDEVQERTAALVLARNAAEAANQAKSAFLASMSHELRTPLNAILGFSNMMRRDASLNEVQHGNLDIINRSGEHLLTLINDVLEMAKIEAGRVQLENKPFDLGGLVRDVTDMMHVRAEEKGLRLLIDQSSEFPRYIKGDEARLRQVLINLVGNAVKFTQQGGVTVRLGGVRHALQHRLLIEVEDSGPGIKPEDQQKIFEPFVQLGETAMQKGTGLGLTITRQFVELMGGTISLESILGRGTIFRIELPVDKAAEADVAKTETASHGEIVGLAPGQPDYRILIVEDQLENQLLLARLMKDIGLDAKLAENGEQAVAMFESWHPHLIWMDRRMPVMDGLEATRRIRVLPGGKDVKIIAVTASAFAEQREESMRAGMDGFVRKPYRFNEIYDVMASELGMKYLYADSRVDEDAGYDVVVTTEVLAKLPADLRQELQLALESLEPERIAGVMQKISACDTPLHKTLSRMIDNFDYPAILAALNLITR